MWTNKGSWKVIFLCLILGPCYEPDSLLTDLIFVFTDFRVEVKPQRSYTLILELSCPTVVAASQKCG